MNNMNITLSTWAGKGGKLLSQTEALKVIAAPRTVTGVFCLTQKTLLCVFILSAWLPFLQPFYRTVDRRHITRCCVKALKTCSRCNSVLISSYNALFPYKKAQKFFCLSWFSVILSSTVVISFLYLHKFVAVMFCLLPTWCKGLKTLFFQFYCLTVD